MSSKGKVVAESTKVGSGHIPWAQFTASVLGTTSNVWMEEEVIMDEEPSCSGTDTSNCSATTTNAVQDTRLRQSINGQTAIVGCHADDGQRA